ncbi:hypothetical protein [Hymenobacter rubripertinctus]|uniref:STAS/SEC14 domain-containing protein n=1 Tax=Hymenobacter rubripertinctus TaxID=2029981 RepID=A0A418QTE6_9BACT|nr:hypothetical protein [Hymenobacter rubripertinctus]RIY08403.1 hypothetical protein D0T11_14270 [Hymenobacter rubripertinctus]
MLPLPLEPLGTLPDANGKPLADIQHSSAHGLLYVQWFGNLTGREVIHVARNYLTLEADLHYPLLLNDKRHSTGDWSEAMEFLEYEWLPQAMQEGLRAVAYVFSPDMHNQLASLEFFERVRQHLAIQLFYDMPAAWQWLRTQSRPQRGVAPVAR